MEDLTQHRKQRLRALIDSPRFHGSQADLSRAAGLSEGRISQLLDAQQSFGERSAKNLAVALGLPERYFEKGFDAPRLDASSPKKVNEELLLGDFVAVRRVDVKFSNGNGQVVYGEDESPPLVFRADFLRKMGIPKGQAFVAIAVGISNEPVICDQSVVLINGADRRLNGDFFAYRVDGELLIKHLDELDGVGVIATAENSSFKPKTKVYSDIEDFEVIGKVVWTGTVL